MSANPTPRELVSSIIEALDAIDGLGSVEDIDADTYRALRNADSALYDFLDFYKVEES